MKDKTEAHNLEIFRVERIYLNSILCCATLCRWHLYTIWNNYIWLLYHRFERYISVDEFCEVKVLVANVATSSRVIER